MSDPRILINQPKEFKLTQEYQGFGFGFQIAQKAVEDLNGQLELNYESNEFTVMIHLPIQASRLIKLEEVSPDNCTCLIVDDNAINRKVLGKMVSKLGLSEEYAVTGLDAVKSYIRNPVSHILMDIQMPVMDGLDASRCIRQYESQHNLKPCKIIAVTAHATHNYGDVCKEAGMDSMLIKPIKLDQIQNEFKFKPKLNSEIEE